ncbi:MAG: hypothetical protein ACJAT7_001610 [Psychromonas sp.]|jgi:hypothetical protein
MKRKIVFAIAVAAMLYVGSAYALELGFYLAQGLA